MSIALTPKPPYYAVIFTSVKNETVDEYGEVSKRMVDLVKKQPGFLGVESITEQNSGMTISYWEDIESINNWRKNFEHQEAQKLGREKFYQSYKVRVCLVERDYSF